MKVTVTSTSISIIYITMEHWNVLESYCSCLKMGSPARRWLVKVRTAHNYEGTSKTHRPWQTLLMLPVRKNWSIMILHASVLRVCLFNVMARRYSFNTNAINRYAKRIAEEKLRAKRKKIDRSMCNNERLTRDSAETGALVVFVCACVWGG